MPAAGQVPPGAPAAFSCEPVGHVESCFTSLRGIPRQGFFAPATRARLVLAPWLQPCTVEGLDQFSHLWITFVFHGNTVAAAEAHANRSRGRVRAPEMGKIAGVAGAVQKPRGRRGVQRSGQGRVC
eukprot:SAG22_NODE_9444_length_589_cov_0.997959_1_plen_125_part_01